MEDSTEDDLKCRGPAEEISKGKNISKGCRAHSCDILAKNMPDFCLPLPTILNGPVLNLWPWSWVSSQTGIDDM